MLQLADSALPVGGFVASNGLESSIQSGHTNSLEKFIRDSIKQCKYSNVPFITSTLSHLTSEISSKLASETNIQKIVAVDKNCQAFMGSNHVNQRASCAQGLAYLTLISRSFPNSNHANLAKEFKALVLRKQAFGHLPICFAICCFCLNIPIKRAEYLYLFLFVRSVVSSAIRMSLIGPYEGQMILFDSKKLVEQVLADTVGPTVDPNLSEMERGWGYNDIEDQAVQTSPVLDILQGSHDRLYTRIFNS
jgi:urease accessory protein